MPSVRGRPLFPPRPQGGVQVLLGTVDMSGLPGGVSLRECTGVVCPKSDTASCAGAVEQRRPYALHSAAAGGTIPGFRSNAWFIDNSTKHSELARSTGDARSRITHTSAHSQASHVPRNGTAVGIGADVFSQMDGVG